MLEAGILVDSLARLCKVLAATTSWMVTDTAGIMHRRAWQSRQLKKRNLERAYVRLATSVERGEIMSWITIEMGSVEGCYSGGLVGSVPPQRFGSLPIGFQGKRHRGPPWEQEALDVVCTFSVSV